MWTSRKKLEMPDAREALPGRGEKMPSSQIVTPMARESVRALKGTIRAARAQ